MSTATTSPASPGPRRRRWHKKFEAMIPAIVKYARFAFRHVRGQDRQDLIQETIANAMVAFRRLVRRGKENVAHASVLAKYAIRQIRDGRRALALLVILLTAAASAIFVLPRFLPPSTPAPVIIRSQGPTIEKLERLSQLVTTRVQVADILVAEGQGCRGSWLIKGDALLSVNLGQAKITDKHEDTKQATIILPEPQVLPPRVDHSRTRTWAVDRLVWLPWDADQDSLRDAVMAEAQKLVAHTAGSPENIQQAKAGAESAIRGLYSELGWQAAVTWAEGGNAPAATEAR